MIPAKINVLLSETAGICHLKAEVNYIVQTAGTILRYAVASDGKVLFEREQGLFDNYALFYIKQFYEMRPEIQAEMEQLAKEIRGLKIDG